MKRTAIALVLVAGCFSGCGKSTSYTGPDGSRATVTNTGKGTEIVVEGKDGGKVQISGGGNLALPDSFPKDVPVYPGATVLTNVTVKDGVHVAFKAADPVDKVAAFYAEKLKAAGFSIEGTVNTGQSSMVAAKKDRRSVGITAAGDAEGSTITVTVQTEDKPESE